MNSLYRMNRKSYLAYCNINNQDVKYADYQTTKTDLKTLATSDTSVGSIFTDIKDYINNPVAEVITLN